MRVLLPIQSHPIQCFRDGIVFLGLTLKVAFVSQRKGLCLEFRKEKDCRETNRGNKVSYSLWWGGWNSPEQKLNSTSPGSYQFLIQQSLSIIKVSPRTGCFWGRQTDSKCYKRMFSFNHTVCCPTNVDLVMIPLVPSTYLLTFPSLRSSVPSSDVRWQMRLSLKMICSQPTCFHFE